jgi:hypothetical protein
MSGRTVGVELTKWVERDQLEWGKTRERIENDYLRIAASERERRPDNIGWVWLYDRHRQVKPKHEAQFRQQLYACIAEQTALAEPEWDAPLGAPVRDFIRYPVLGKFLDQIWIHPRPRLHYPEAGGKWILFEGNAGGAYTHESMVKGALDRIRAKIDDYEELDLHSQHTLDELYLLCHYDNEALLYNTPVQAVGFGYEDLVAKVAEVLAQGHGVFNRIFLFHPWESRKVAQVYPVVTNRLQRRA